MERKDSRARHFYLHMLTGGSSIAVAKTLTAPLERAKLILQTNSLQSAETGYPSLSSYMSEVPKNEGLGGFWRGNCASIFKIFPSTAIRFAYHHRIRRRIVSKESTKLEEFASGVLSAMITLLFCYPIDLARTRIAADCSPKGIERVYSGMIDCLSKTMKDNGIKGVYKGLSVSMFGLVPFMGISMAVHEEILKKSNAKSNEHSVVEFLESGTAAGLVAAVTVYPLDTIRRILQVSNARNFPEGYNGVFSCLTATVKKDGILGLYRGCLLNILKTVPSFAIQITIYDIWRFYLK